jgi:hypothetical protein
MDNSTIEQINKIFKTKKLTWCGNFLRHDENAKQDCYNFTFQIKEIKPMISVGEWKDHALVDVTLYVDPNTVLGKLVSGEYKEIWGESENLLRFYPIKYGTAEKITNALKLVSKLDVIVKSIKPVLIGNEETITEDLGYRKTVRDVVRDIVFEIKKNLRSKGEITFPEYNLGQHPPFDLVLKINPTPKKHRHELLKPFDVQAFWVEGEDTIEVEVDIDENAGNEIFYELIGELNDDIRHELEHRKQEYSGYEFPDKEYKQPLRYYTQQHEIEAQVAGFKRKAKIQGRKIEDVMREFFDRRKQIYNLKQSTIDKIVGRLMDEYLK